MKRSVKIIIAVLTPILFLMFLGAIGSTIQSDSSSPVIKKLTKDQVIVKALNGLSYDDLMRYNEKYVNEIIHQKTSKVVQMQNIYGDNYMIMVNTATGTYNFDLDLIWLNYEGARILEDDIVEFWGTVKGLKEYETTLGSINTIPEIDVLYLDVVKKGG